MANNNAPLPEIYKEAKFVLSVCTEIDECKAWADKALALGSYAKQANDESLEKLAKKIRANAMKRCGELLREFDGRPDNAKKQTEGNHGLISQREAAEQAGMSEWQQLQAVRIANIPENVFIDLVESDSPPTTTELAELGKRNNGVIKYENNINDNSMGNITCPHCGGIFHLQAL